MKIANGEIPPLLAGGYSTAGSAGSDGTSAVSIVKLNSFANRCAVRSVTSSRPVL